MFGIRFPIVYFSLNFGERFDLSLVATTGKQHVGLDVGMLGFYQSENFEPTHWCHTLEGSQFDPEQMMGLEDYILSYCVSGKLCRGYMGVS